MSLVIHTNVSALSAQRHLRANTSKLAKALERLSSGYRINHAGNDAAGLQVSETLRSQIRGISQAQKNAEEGINMLSVAEGTITTINENLQRMRELLIQAANETNGPAQRGAIAQEIVARKHDIQRISDASEYNGIYLLRDSSLGYTLIDNIYIQVGPNDDVDLDAINVGQTVGVLGAMDAEFSLQIPNDAIILAMSGNDDARTLLGSIDYALTYVGTKQAAIGAVQNQLESAISNLEITGENLSAAESRIRNADIASESAKMARYQILQQVSVSILAQANQSPTLALSLLNR